MYVNNLFKKINLIFKMKIKKKKDAEKGICSECMRLFGANVFNLLLNLQNIFRDLFKKKSNIVKVSIFKVQRNLQNTYRHLIQTSSWHKPNQYS